MFTNQLGSIYKTLGDSEVKEKLSHRLWSGHPRVPRNTPEKNKQTENKHVVPCPAYLNPECHLTGRWESSEHSLPEDALLTSKAQNYT